MLDLAMIERLRDAIADTMRTAAQTIRDQFHSEPREAAGAEPGTYTEWGTTTSEWLERWSEDIRQWDVRESDSRLRSSIQDHPGSTLLLAGAAGLLLGRLLAFRRR
ncbi:MAG TPA: hypothetical protein VFO62_05410 [Candidatus Binatia bacterium]|nr:hypothetical protein [Candidatus Binatia bacterium]